MTNDDATLVPYMSTIGVHNISLFNYLLFIVICIFITRFVYQIFRVTESSYKYKKNHII